MQHTTDSLRVLLDVSTEKPTETTVLPLAKQFPQQVNLVFEPVPATAPNHGPTMGRPTTRSCWQRPVTVFDMSNKHSGRIDTSLTGVSIFCDDGTRYTVQTTSVERATRRDKTRTGGRRLCTLVVWFFFAATLLTVDVVGAVFAPADRAALKAAVGTCGWGGSGYVCTGGCLGETADGSCPILAASHVPGTVNPYGVIGDWDVSAVTRMDQSKCTLSPSLWPRLPLLCILNTRHQSRFIGSQFSHVLLFCCCVFEIVPFLLIVVGGWSFLFFVAHSLAVFERATAFNQDVSNWNTGAVTNMFMSKCTLSSSLWPRLPLLCILNIRQLEFHRITILTRFCFFVLCV
jgi:surface protein